MNVANKKNKLLIAFLTLLVAAGSCFADGTYKNNLVDVRVNKESGGAVKVTIYTDKPYSEPIVVNKKANNRYVILMPETRSSMSSEPSVTNAAGTISSVSVSTPDVAGGQGYTKIVITSQKAVTIIPATQQLSVAQKISEDNKAAALKAKQEAERKAAALKAKQEAEQKAAALKAKQEAKRKEEAQRVQQAAEKKAAAQRARQEAQKRAEAQRIRQEAERKAAALKAKQESEKKIAAQKAAQNTAETSQPMQPIEVLEQEINTGKNAKFTADNNDPVLKKEIQGNAEKNKYNNKKNVPKETNNKQSMIDNIKTIIHDYHDINIWKLILLAGAVIFPFIVITVILGLDKKINKRIDRSFKKETSYRNEPVQNKRKEKLYNSFEEMLDEVDEQSPSYHEEQYSKTKSSDYAPPVLEPNDSVTSGNISTDEEAVEEVIDKNEFEDDFEKEDFEHDFENIPEENELPETDILPEDDALLEEPEKSEESEEQAAAVPYNPDGYLADFSNVNDKDFFDELVLQSMAEVNTDGLPDEIPADDVFNLIQDDAAAQSESCVGEISDFPSTTWNGNNKQTDSITQTKSSDDDLTMLTEVKLNDNSGLYLVNYENFSSLVGHIDDDYFVIKKFDDITKGNIILKQTEKLENSTRYIVRVGKNKMVVEVSATSMNKLLDL